MKTKETLRFLLSEIDNLKKRVAVIEGISQPPQLEMFAEPKAEFLKQEKKSAAVKNRVDIWFDGGMKHGVEGYGSFMISVNGCKNEIVRLEHPKALTSNMAELLTLNEALREATGIVNPKESDLVVIGDSQLALFCSSGRWKAKHPNVKPIAAANKMLISMFARSDVKWQPREVLVRIFGH